MKCDLMHDEHGWWMQYTGKNDGKLHCVSMDAETEVGAVLEAMEEGFVVDTIGYVPDEEINT